MASGSGFWNRVAFAYDFATRKGDEGLMAAAAYVGAFVGPRDVVLDAACGTGAFACALAPKAGFVAGCDFAPSMVTRARAKAERLGIENASFEVGDITDLAVDDASVDVVVAANVLHLLDDPLAAVSELRRVARPGGVIAIPNYVNDEAADSRFLKLIAAVGFSTERDWSEQSFLGFLGEAGLEVAEHRMFEAKQPLCVAICRG